MDGSTAVDRAPLVQGAPEWREWRGAGIGASDAPVVMGVSPFKTAHRLWREKTGRVQPVPATSAMRRGVLLESEAHRAYEQASGNIVQPNCVTHPQFDWMRASLDGVTFEGDVILEVKCPGHDDHTVALEGRVPEKYYPQLQHALAVSGARSCHYWSYDGSEGVLVEVRPDQDYIGRLIEVEQKFWDSVVNDQPPPLSASDTVEREDPEWMAAVIAWRREQARLNAVQKAEQRARERLIDMACGQSCRGGGVRVTRFERRGGIDYKKIPELQDVDLESYRRAPHVGYRITEEDTDR